MSHTHNFITAFLLASLAALHAADPPAENPHVVLIMVDDLGWMGSYSTGSVM